MSHDLSTFPKLSIHTQTQLRVYQGKDPLKFAVVQARFNGDITEAMQQLCMDALNTEGINQRDIFTATVPGALEIPVALQWLHDKHRVDAMIGLGCVIRGDTFHFEVVSLQSAKSLADLSLSTNTAVINGIMTCNNHAQALERLQSTPIHCAHTAIELALLRREHLAS